MDIFDGDFFCESEFSPIPLISALSTEVYAGVSPQCVGSPRCVFFFMTLREGNVQALQRIGPGRASALSYCFTHVFLSGKNLGRPSIAAWLVARCLQPQLVTTARVALVSRPGWSLRGAASAEIPAPKEEEAPDAPAALSSMKSLPGADAAVVVLQYSYSCSTSHSPQRGWLQPHGQVTKQASLCTAQWH